MQFYVTFTVKCLLCNLIRITAHCLHASWFGLWTFI